MGNNLRVGVDCCYDSLYLLVCHDGTDGQAENLLVQHLGQWVALVVPGFVGLLLVWWDGVVDQGLDALVLQVRL